MKRNDRTSMIPRVIVIFLQLRCFIIVFIRKSKETNSNRKYDNYNSIFDEYRKYTNTYSSLESRYFRDFDNILSRGRARRGGPIFKNLSKRSGEGASRPILHSGAEIKGRS